MGALDGQAALVTGGGSGIGRAAALALAADGASVALVGRRRPLLEATAEVIAANGGTALVLAADVANPDQARDAVAQTEAAFGRLDVLVNNAGANTAARSVRTTSPDDIDELTRVNVTGPLTLTQAALPGMLERGGGVVITVASYSVVSPGPPAGTAYSVSKAAAATLMQSVNTEFRNRGVRACTIYPGEVDTQMLDSRPLVPDAAARATMMHADDLAQIILLCARMPARTLIEEIYVRPTHQRNMQADIAAAMEF